VKNYSNFSLCLSTDLLFGKGREKEVGRMVRKHGGTKVMLVYGRGSIKKSGLYDRVVQALKEENLPFVELAGVKANPRRSLVEQGIKVAQEAKVDFLLPVGGGSVIDTAKAIALALANGGTYWQFWNGTPPAKMAPVGTINTIAAAGSEMSRSAVLVDDLDTGQKRGFMWDPARPVFAILNPELTYTVSPWQTGAGTADIFAHTFMRYFWLDDLAGSLGDAFAEGLLRTVVTYGPIALAKPEDYEARAELMLAAAFSHSDLTQLGRSGPYGGEHAMEHQLSGHYDTPHGAGLSVVMPAFLRYVVDHGPPQKAARAAQFGVRVFHAPLDMTDPRGTALGGICLFKQWLKSIGMPVTLPELGIPREDLPQAIERCVKANKGMIRGFMEFDEKAIAEIYRIMAGD